MDPVVTLSLKIIPLIEDKKEIYRVVDEVIEMISQTGLKYEVSASETTIEGPMSEVLSVVNMAHLHAVNNGVEKIQSVIMIDYDVDGVKIEDKVYKYRS